jgi:uncharacterized membrane protein YphA (DoxX/SURF4 family)
MDKKDGKMKIMNAARTELVLRILLGSVFIFSAISKLVSVGLFEIAIVDQGLAATREQAAWPARLVIAFEMFLGVSLLFPYFLKRFLIPLAILTLAAFTLLLGYQLTFGEQSQDCGCFGELLPMSSGESLVKNFVLLGMSLWFFRITREGKRKIVIPALLAVGSVAAVLLVAPVRQDYDGIFAKYTQFENAGRVDLTKGDKLVATFNAECEHCQETAKDLDTLATKSANFPKIYVLMFSESEATIADFSQKTNTAFPYHVISEGEFFDLIGNRPPRIYWLQDGQIKARWDEEFTEHILSAFDIAAAASLP